MCYTAKIGTGASAKVGANECVLVGWVNENDLFDGNSFNFTKASSVN